MVSYSFGFDPDQPGARRLLRLANDLRTSATVELRIRWIQDGHVFQPGERVELPASAARELVDAGDALAVGD